MKHPHVKSGLLSLLSIGLFLGIFGIQAEGMDHDLYTAIGGDPSGFTQIPFDELVRRTNAVDLDGDGWITPAEIQAVNNGTAASYKGNKTKTNETTNNSSLSNNSASNGKASKTKVTATFKNLYGVIIGSSQITKGTDIAKSQFPKSVPDIKSSIFLSSNSSLSIPLQSTSQPIN